MYSYSFSVAKSVTCETNTYKAWVSTASDASSFSLYVSKDAKTVNYLNVGTSLIGLNSSTNAGASWENRWRLGLITLKVTNNTSQAILDALNNYNTSLPGYTCIVNFKYDTWGSVIATALCLKVNDTYGSAIITSLYVNNYARAAKLSGGTWSYPS